jgi:dienelactone hydrolase
MPRIVALLLGWSLLLATLPATLATDPAAPSEKATSPEKAAEIDPYRRGRAMIRAYFRQQVEVIADHCLHDLTTRQDWEKHRPELRRQFLEMMGLWPLPARTDLKPVITGRVAGEGFTVEKLQFQSWPGLYVTANVYLPKEATTSGRRYPAVLYLCGHGNFVSEGVSYGSKVYYQYHPAWFASHGYVAMVLDTLQLSEIPGFHHGTHHLGWWWWQTRGYTPAGIECWNAMRAIDYLETRPEVDAKRIGVTGRSGGGASTWWVLAADDRPQVFAPVAGIADLQAHVCQGATPRYADGVISGHCDCMYPVNLYRWDFPMIAALAAPRPLLLGNSDDDPIFPVEGYRRIAEKVRNVYALYGPDAAEKFQLLETKGPHKDTPELRIGINRWMNRWLKGDVTSKVEDDLPPPLPPQALKVLARTPEDAINASVHEYFIKPAQHVLPNSEPVAKAWWSSRKEELLRDLSEKVFAGWAVSPPDLHAKLAGEFTADGVRLRAVDFLSEAEIPLRLWIMTAADVQTPTKVILSVLDHPGWDRWCADLGPEFSDLLEVSKDRKVNRENFEQNRAAMRHQRWAYAAIAPRGVGPTAWAKPGSPEDIHIRRRFALIGQTLDGQRVWDIRRAVAALAILPDLREKPLMIQGHGEAGILGLYAALFEPAVTEIDLWYPPTSHREGPTFLHVARILDIPQAIALAGPRPVSVHIRAASEKTAWEWPERLARATGHQRFQIIPVGE